jgi:outer membrane protein OmpA-like peptidoglycan-associated protein
MKVIRAAGFSAAVAIGIASAQPPAHNEPQPIYRVTVVSRSLDAVNYEHRGGPTPIDFQGTVLLPHARGTAIVESHRGSVAIDAKFEHLEAPTRFGREYLTYVLWAISPEGRPRNLGEVLVDSSNKAHVRVTTDLQAFGLMLTAEPYYSVSIPSDVVVAENRVRPDTIGAREEVTAKYELLPRGQYTMNIQASQLRSVEGGEKLSYDRYEAVLELYQAENAIQIARSLGADQYAPEPMRKATALLTQAQDMNARKMDTHAIVSAAREAAQTAEDARTIAVKRRDEEHHVQEVQQRSQNQSELRKAEEDAAPARAQAEAGAQQAAQARYEAAANAGAQAAQQAEHASLSPPPPPPPVQTARVQNPDAARQQLRAQLLAQLNSRLTTRDTPRGLVVTVTDWMFERGNDGLRAEAGQRLGYLASILASHPGLRVRVEGYAAGEGRSEERAQAIRSALIARGARPDSIIAVGYGDSRPLVSNATAAGREQNRRVEVVIYGDSIGNQALWDRPYSLRSQR